MAKRRPNRPKTRVISVIAEHRRRVPDGLVTGADAVAALEEIIRDAYAVAGIDADAPMRRDIVVVVRNPPPEDKRDVRKLTRLHASASKPRKKKSKARAGTRKRTP